MRRTKYRAICGIWGEIALYFVFLLLMMKLAQDKKKLLDMYAQQNPPSPDHHERRFVSMDQEVCGIFADCTHGQ